MELLFRSPWSNSQTQCFFGSKSKQMIAFREIPGEILKFNTYAWQLLYSHLWLVFQTKTPLFHRILNFISLKIAANEACVNRLFVLFQDGGLVELIKKSSGNYVEGEEVEFECRYLGDAKGVSLEWRIISKWWNNEATFKNIDASIQVWAYMYVIDYCI